MYEPQEDSFLLQDFVKKRANGTVLDMGTGTGIQALTAARVSRVKKVIAVDVDSHAISFAKNNNKHCKIKYLESDLFSRIGNQKFDTIIFNPPYLPKEGKTQHLELEGGKEGHEVIARFLADARKHLAPKGNILLVCSSLTPHLQEMFENNLFTARELGKKHVFFENILVYSLAADPRVIELEGKKVRGLTYFAHGKRGVIFTGTYRGKKVAVKMVRQKSQSPGTIALEACALIEVNRNNIGPHYLLHTKHALVYEFVRGKHLEDVMNSPNIKHLCKKVFEQCRKLDLLHINKQEMTRPLKHVLVNRNKVTLIDFERARKTEKPHNVTQFCQFVGNHVMREQKKDWILLAQEYARLRNQKVFKKILRTLS